MLLGSTNNPIKDVNSNLVVAQETCPGGTSQTCQQLCNETDWTCKILKETIGIEVCDGSSCKTACDATCNS